MTFSLTDAQVFNKALLRLGEKAGKVFDVTGLDSSYYGVMAFQEYQSTRNEELRLNNWIFALKRAPLIASGTLPAATGFTNAWQLPVDCLRVVSVYVPLTTAQAASTYGTQHAHEVPFIEENGVVYCDVAAGGYIKYVQEWPVASTFTANVPNAGTQITGIVAPATSNAIVRGYGVASTHLTAGQRVVSVDSATAFTVDSASGAWAGGNEVITVTPYWYEPLFADALACRLALKISAAAITNVPKETTDRLLAEYAMIIQRAMAMDAVEASRNYITSDREETRQRIDKKIEAIQRQQTPQQGG